MPVPDVITGRDARVNGVSTLGHFRIVKTSIAGPIRTSNTSGGVARGCGTIDWEGYYYAYGHTPPVWLNEQFTFSGTLANEETTGGAAICTGIDIIIPQKPQANMKNYISYVVHFGAMGADLTNATETIADSSAPAIYCASGLKLKLDNVEETDIEEVQISLRSAVAKFANSSTNGFMKRTPGNIDWTVAYIRAVNKLSLLPAAGEIKTIKAYVESDKYWEFQFGRVSKPFDIKVDHETDEITTAAVALDMTSHNGTTLGVIKNPAGTTKWP
jgi:hypothetical protein